MGCSSRSAQPPVEGEATGLQETARTGGGDLWLQRGSRRGGGAGGEARTRRGRTVASRKAGNDDGCVGHQMRRTRELDGEQQHERCRGGEERQSTDQEELRLEGKP